MPLGWSPALAASLPWRRCLIVKTQNAIQHTVLSFRLLQMPCWAAPKNRAANHHSMQSHHNMLLQHAELGSSGYHCPVEECYDQEQQ